MCESRSDVVGTLLWETAVLGMDWRGASWLAVKIRLHLNGRAYRLRA